LVDEVEPRFGVKLARALVEVVVLKIFSGVGKLEGCCSSPF
jgi:hypothetical protein